MVIRTHTRTYLVYELMVIRTYVHVHTHVPGLGTHGDTYTHTYVPGLGTHGNTYTHTYVPGLGTHGNTYTHTYVPGLGTHGDTYTHTYVRTWFNSWWYVHTHTYVHACIPGLGTPDGVVHHTIFQVLLGLECSVGKTWRLWLSLAAGAKRERVLFCETVWNAWGGIQPLARRGSYRISGTTYTYKEWKSNEGLWPLTYIHLT